MMVGLLCKKGSTVNARVAFIFSIWLALGISKVCGEDGEFLKNLSSEQRWAFANAQCADSSLDPLEAATIYAEILDELPKDSASQNEELLWRVCSAHLQAGNTHEVLRRLQSDACTLESSRLQVLLAIAEYYEGDTEAAKSTLHSLCEKADCPIEAYELQLHLHIEQGRASDEIYPLLEALRTLDANGEKSARALIKVAHLYLMEKKPTHSLRLLDIMDTSTSVTKPLQTEAHLIRGVAFMDLNAPFRAITHLTACLESPLTNKELSNCATEHLIDCYLQLAEASLTEDVNRAQDYLESTNNLLKKIEHPIVSDSAKIQRARYFILSSKTGESDSLEKAFQLLNQLHMQGSPKIKARVLRLQAQSASDCEARDRYWGQLLQLEPCQTAEIWFHRGNNFVDEAKRLKQRGQTADADHYWAHAARCFQEAYTPVAEIGSPENTPAVSGLLTVAIESSSLLCIQTALANISMEQLYEEDLFRYVLACVNFTKFVSNTEKDTEAVAYYQKKYPDGAHAAQIAFIEAQHRFDAADYEQASRLFQAIFTRFPNCNEAGDALYWSARSQAALANAGQLDTHILKQIVQDYPSCSMAAEAYLHIYSYQEYLQGRSEAIAHLEAMPNLFPKSPYLINAYYLIGLDAKRSRRADLSSTYPQRDWDKAITAFQYAEQIFDDWYKKASDCTPLIRNQAFLKHRATLERALANLAIACESRGAKKHVYLHYSIDQLEQLLALVLNQEDALTQNLRSLEGFSLLVEETRYSLALALSRDKQYDEAYSQIQELLKTYEEAQVMRGYYLSKAYGLHADISIRKGDYRGALKALAPAEEAARGRVLNSDEKLSLWLNRAQCYTQLGELDLAMKELSRVINDDSISPLRIKAMYLRAELYERQERSELAHKQLLAIAKQKGIWAKKARDKLQTEYSP